MGKRVYIFTGGPYSGKTTMLNLFKEMDYTTVPEAAMVVIKELQKKWGVEKQRIFIENNIEEFQQMIVDKQKENEKKVLKQKNHKDDIIILDRSIIDSLGYLHFNKKEWQNYHYEMANNTQYKKVFLFDTLKSFNHRKETGRANENFEVSNNIKNSLHFTYRYFGYEPHVLEEKSIYKRFQEIAYLMSRNC